MQGDDEAIAKVMMEEYHVKFPVCPETCGIWMIRCGAKYGKKEQSYCHDLHERPDVVAYREKYIARDMGTLANPSLRELSQYQWIQMTKVKADEFVKMHTAPGAAARLMEGAFTYTLDAPRDRGVRIRDGIIGPSTMLPFDYVCAGQAVGDLAVAEWRSNQPVDVVEFHVEVSESLDDWRATTLFGGNLSRRLLPCQRPLIYLGQDESIFNSESGAARHWSVDGVTVLTPKSGISLMASAWTSGALGFGIDLSAEQLATVNAYRQQPDIPVTVETYMVSGVPVEIFFGGQVFNTYKCGRYGAPQALCKLGGVTETDKKPILDSSPFIRTIFNAKAKDGYWTNNHMMVQTEDVVDVIRALYPWLGIGAEFDQSGVHATMKKDALNVNKMNEKFGGKQTLKRPTVMTAGCLGPFPALRIVDGVQCDVKIKVGDTQLMVFKEGDLPPHYALDTPALDTPTGVPVQPRKAKRKRNACAKLMGGAIAEETLPMVPGVRAGYVGKAKGLLDVLFERGWIDPSIKYTMKGCAAVGKKQSGSLELIMAKCEDFISEVTAMHELMELLGVEMDQTPKGHPEIAGRGVEYDWGKGKMTYRHTNDYSSHPDAFEKRVRAALATVTVERARRFLRKANDYKRAYRALSEGAGPNEVATYADIEKLRKEVKAHRSTLDQDYKFIALA